MRCGPSRPWRASGSFMANELGVVEDLEGAGRRPVYEQRASQLGLHAVLAVPMNASGQTIGVINIYREAGHRPCDLLGQRGQVLLRSPPARSRPTCRSPRPTNQQPIDPVTVPAQTLTRPPIRLRRLGRPVRRRGKLPPKPRRRVRAASREHSLADHRPLALQEVHDRRQHRRSPSASIGGTLAVGALRCSERSAAARWWLSCSPSAVPAGAPAAGRACTQQPGRRAIASHQAAPGLDPLVVRWGTATG